MATLTKKAMVLFAPKEYRQLEKIAHGWGASTGELIRQAVRIQFLNKEKISKEEALQTLTQNTSMAFSWKKWDKEFAKNKAHS